MGCQCEMVETHPEAYQIRPSPSDGAAHERNARSEEVGWKIFSSPEGTSDSH